MDVSWACTIWTVRAGGYINIYPDGHVRVGKRCRQTWNAKHSAAADEDDRKMRQVHGIACALGGLGAFSFSLFLAGPFLRSPD